MRHGKKRHKLRVSGPHRLALLANLSNALIKHGKIKTTLAKAKALRPFIEKIITLAKKAESSNDAERKLHFRRLAISRLNDPDTVATLFDELVNEFMERPGGYTRIYKLGQRIGDAAEMGLIELIDANDEGYSRRPSRKVATRPAEEETKTTVEKDLAEDVSETAAAAVDSETVEEASDDEEGTTATTDADTESPAEPSEEDKEKSN